MAENKVFKQCPLKVAAGFGGKWDSKEELEEHAACTGSCCQWWTEVFTDDSKGKVQGCSIALKTHKNSNGQYHV